MKRILWNLYESALQGAALAIVIPAIVLTLAPACATHDWSADAGNPLESVSPREHAIATWTAESRPCSACQADGRVSAAYRSKQDCTRKTLSMASSNGEDYDDDFDYCVHECSFGHRWVERDPAPGVSASASK